jgi:hypothetical protein
MIDCEENRITLWKNAHIQDPNPKSVEKAAVSHWIDQSPPEKVDFYKYLKNELKSR